MPTLVKILLGIVVPPVAIFLTYGFSTTLIINLVLTVLGWVPGSIHAVWAITKQMEKADQAGNPT
jgi:uncharacterized membrane protein YqaE (UPF0057 family)